jgi:hypothetical protein
MNVAAVRRRGGFSHIARARLIEDSEPIVRHLSFRMGQPRQDFCGLPS